MVDLNSVKELNKELEDAIVNFSAHHSKMREMRAYYQKSAFFAPKAGDPRLSESSRRKNNYLKIFANKNIEYTSAMPIIKVPTPGADPQQRKAASVREKILYAVHEQNGTALLQKKWAFDATVMSCAVSEVGMNLRTRKVYVKRYDPRFVVWTFTNDNEPRVSAFWAVFSVSADEAWKRWGVKPKKNPLSELSKEDELLRHADGKDWFTMAIRWDGETRTAWVGDVLIEEPHKHMMGVIPVDVCQPFEDGDTEGRGAFYLEDLVPMQAELNDIILRRSNVVRRMSSPVVWARGLAAGQAFDDIKRNFKEQGGGFVGLKQTGDMGVLQINETKIFQEAKDDVIMDMMRQSGFNTAAFGESTGANTSGDALGMYFSGTQRHIQNQMINWRIFWQSINSKILRAYDVYGMTGEQFQVEGSAPGSTLLTSTDDAGQSSAMVQRGAFSEIFDRTIVDGKYHNVCSAPTVTPKNEIEDRRQAMDAVTTGFMSRTSAYEAWGILDPEAELALLQQEKSDPLLNPEGTSAIISAMQQKPQAPALAPPAPPTATAALSGQTL